MLTFHLGFSGLLCEEIVNQIFASITEIVERDGKLIITNFGKFTLHKKNARPGVNMKTGEAIIIHPRNVIRFLPSIQFKKMLNAYDKKD